MTSVDIIDDYTIRLNLTEFRNTILTNLDSVGRMVSPTAIEKNGLEWCDYHPVSTGPYKFTSWVRDTSLEMERFDDYWGDRPYLDRIKFVFIADPMTAAMALQAGNGQVFMLDMVQDMGRDLEKKGYRVVISPMGMMALMPDSMNPDSILANKKVREAVEYAIDKESIAKALGQGYWRTYYQIAPEIAFGYVPELEEQGRKYNPTKAKQLLAEAGYPNGFKTTVMTRTTIKTDPLVAIQANLKAVGITLDLDIVSDAVYQQHLWGTWTGFHYGDPSQVTSNWCADLQRYYRSGTMFWQSVYRPPELDAVIDEAVKARTLEEQTRLTQEATRIAFDDCTVIPLWSMIRGFAFDKTVQDAGFCEYKSPSDWDFRHAWLSKK
jgi:ABC-type transport system substrate-binding protein